MDTKFNGLNVMDIGIRGLHIMHNITKVKEYFVGISNSWIAIPMKETK